MKIGCKVLTIVLLLLLSTGYVAGVGVRDELTVTGYVVNGRTPTLLWEQNGNYGLLLSQDNLSTWALIKFDDDMNLVPLHVYHVSEPEGCTVYPSSIVQYKEGFLIAGSMHSQKNSPWFHWGFWLVYIDKNGNVLWARAYLTRFTSTISKVLVDNSSGRILIIGSGSFYSGGDGFVGVFNPETQKLERLVALGGLNTDRIDDVLMPGDGTYIIVGNSWSLGDVQGKPFVVRLTKNFSVINSVAFTLLDSGIPVKSADWRATYAKYSNGTIRLFGNFLVKKYGPDKIRLQKSGLWWMTLDENFNPISYSFKETTVNSSPIELGYSGVLNLYHYPSTNDSMIVSGVYLNYDRFFMGWIHEGSIDGYFINVNRSPSAYYPSFISPFTPVFTMDNSLVLMLSTINYSNVNFKSYNPLLAIKIPYSKLHNIEALKKTFLYGGNFSVKLQNADFSVKESRNFVPTNMKLLNVEIHPANITIVPVDTPLNVIELRNPMPTVAVEISPSQSVPFPKDADIYVDGKNINWTSEGYFNLLPGTHNVTVTRPGFISPTQVVNTITVHPFARYWFNAGAFASFLQISVSPENSTIKITCTPNYTYKYKFTFNISSNIKGIILPTGYHCLVSAVKDGYIPQSKDTWTSSTIINLAFNLQPMPTRLIISSNLPADVLVNGKSYGKTPKNLSLNPGNYNVVLSRQGYQNYSVKVILKPGEIKRLNVTLTPLKSFPTSSTSTSTSVAHNETYSPTSSTPVQNTSAQPSGGERNVCGPAFIILLSLLALVMERMKA